MSTLKWKWRPCQTPEMKISCISEVEDVWRLGWWGCGGSSFGAGSCSSRAPTDHAFRWDRQNVTFESILLEKFRNVLVVHPSWVNLTQASGAVRMSPSLTCLSRFHSSLLNASVHCYSLQSLSCYIQSHLDTDHLKPNWLKYGLQDYIAVKEKYARYMPHSAGRFEINHFWSNFWSKLKPVQIRSEEVP